MEGSDCELFDNRDSWKVDFSSGTLGILYPETLGRFMFNLHCPPILWPQGPPWGSWNCDWQKNAKYFMLGGLDGSVFNKIWSNQSVLLKIWDKVSWQHLRWMSGFSALNFQTKSIVIWWQSFLKSRFLLRNIRKTVSWKPGKVFGSTCTAFLFLDPFLDCKVWPEGFGIVMDKKIAKYFMWGGLYGEEFNKIWSN